MLKVILVTLCLGGGGLKLPLRDISASRLARNNISMATPHVFGLNGAIGNTPRWNRQSEIHDSGWNNAITRISANIGLHDS